MSTKRYIELVSSRRNRTLYPLVSSFEVPLGGMNNLCYDVRKAVDPVSNSAPIYAFFLNSIYPPELPGSSTPEAYQMNLGNNYSNSTLQLDPSDTIVDPTYNNGVSIMNNMYRTYNTTDGTKGYIINDSDVAYTIDGAPVTGAYRKIVSQSANVIGATLDVPMPYIPPATGSTDDYYMFDGSSQTPVGTNFTYDQSLFVNPQPYDIFGKPTPPISELFSGYYLALQRGAYRTANTLDGNTPLFDQIVGHNTDQRFLRLSKNLPIDSPNEYYQPFTIRKFAPSNQHTIVQDPFDFQITTIGYSDPFPPASDTMFITVGGLSPTTENISGYLGQYLFITPYVSDPVTFVRYPVYPTLNDVPTIKDAYFYRIEAASIDPVTPTNAIFRLNRPIIAANYAQPTKPTPASQTSRVIEILPITYDNFVPLNYTGSVVSQTETACYEIELNSLTLPNVVLKSGSRIAFYPYVYVTLENVMTPNGGTKNIFYSNNPSTSKALFVAPVTDLNDPLTTPFVRIDGFGIIQTIKFKPNDTLRFRVFLPDGSPFDPVESDDFSPQPPNPLMQISAVFGIKRL